MVASLLLMCGAAYFSYKAFTEFSAISSIESELEQAQSDYQQLDSQYQTEVEKKEAMGFDIKLVQNSIKIYQELQQQDIKTLKFFRQVGTGLGQDLNLDRISVKKKDNSTIQQLFSTPGGADDTPLYEAKMQLTYPSTTDVEKGNQEVLDLEQRLQLLLPDHSVKATKLLEDYEYSEELVVEEENPDAANINQDFVAEITIEGPPIVMGTQ